MRKPKNESVKVNRELLDRVRAISHHTGAQIYWLVNKALSEWLTSREDELLGRKK